MDDYVIRITIPGPIKEEYFSTVSKALRYMNQIPNPDAGKILVEDEDPEPDKITNTESKEDFFQKEIIKWMNGVYQTEKSNEQNSALDGIV